MNDRKTQRVCKISLCDRKIKTGIVGEAHHFQAKM